MRVLENFKNKWKKEDSIYINFSSAQISEFIHNDSKSLVKRIYTTSVIEFCFWFLFNVYISYTSIDPMSQTSIDKVVEWLNLMNYFVLIYFIFQFYNAKKNIYYCNDTKSFLFKILQLIRIANNYIIYNMIIAVVCVLLAGLKLLLLNPNYLHSVKATIVLVIALIFSGGFILIILYLLYKFLYGRFLKKLQANYDELNKNFS